VEHHVSTTAHTTPAPFLSAHTRPYNPPRPVEWDAVRCEQRVISVPVEEAFTTVLQTDFRDVPMQSRAVRALFAIRSTAERVVSFLLRQQPVVPPAFGAMRLADLPSRGEWVRLGVDAPNRISFGAIGRFWDGETRWLVFEAADFERFSRPGYAKIRCDIGVLPLDDCLTALTYECRTLATDPSSRREFLRYWRVVSPFVGVVLRATLRLFERRGLEAQRAAANWRRPAGYDQRSARNPLPNS
jgi:hypothetical protein